MLALLLTYFTGHKQNELNTHSLHIFDNSFAIKLKNYLCLGGLCAILALRVSINCHWQSVVIRFVSPDLPTPPLPATTMLASMFGGVAEPRCSICG